MTDFDKLIKEKAEQADYAYKPAAWRSFRRKVGFGQSTLKYWVAGVSSAVVIGGFTTFLLLRNTNTTQGNESSPNAVAMDTVPLNVDGGTCLEDDTLLLSDDRILDAPRITKTVPAPASEQNLNADANHSSEKPEPKESVNPRYGRPLVIDVDTIEENVPTDEELQNGHSRLY